MFQKIRKHIRFIKNSNVEGNFSLREERYIKDKYIIDRKLTTNVEKLKKLLGTSDDVIFKEFKLGNKEKTKVFICYIDGLIDKSLLNEVIIRSLMTNKEHNENIFSEDIFIYIKELVINSTEVDEVNLFNDVLDNILSGNISLFIDSYDKALIIDFKGGEKRTVAEPETEVSVRGPREGFTETLRINTSLLRRKIKNPNLTFKSFILGKQTHTIVSIAYINGIVDMKIVEEVKRRLNGINTDIILESGYIEQFIEEHPFSPFSTIGNSEKPDKVAAKLLEGRVAILCDGTPFVLTVPHLFIESLQVSEDYYSRFLISSIIRFFRFIAFCSTLLVPALYVAVETFHQEMVPTNLIVTSAASREGIPFPAFIETLIMVTIFELLRESGIRLPRQVGQAVSIVGALIIGDSAVRAGIISAPMVIIGAFMGITSFVVTPLLDAIIIFRFLFLFLSSSFGLFGITIGLMIMLAHMCSLKSFGVPYLSPFAPTILKDLKDTLIRVPIWLMKSRPSAIIKQNSKRQR